MQTYKIAFVVFHLCFYLQLLSQAPASNIYLFDFQIIGDSLKISNPRFLTNFNSEGYNNQPYFITDEEVYISSNWNNGPDQTDIYSLNINDNTLMKITDTEEREYSPTLMPDNENFSVVRVQTDENSSQVLWKYPLERNNPGQPVIKDLVNIGYHQWLEEDLLALFLVGHPNKLILRDLKTKREIDIAENAGRCLQVYQGKIHYIYKLSDQFWQLKYYDPKLGRSVMLRQTLPDREDFEITDNGHFLMGSGSDLYLYRLRVDQNWRKVAQLNAYGITNITRIRTKGNRLLIVDTKM